MTNLTAIAITQTPFPTPELDPNYVFGELMPLIAVVTIVIASSIGLRWMFRSPVGEALAERIRGGRRASKAITAEQERDRAELEERVSHLQEQVGELAERVEFTERLLAGQRGRQLGREG